MVRYFPHSGFVHHPQSLSHFCHRSVLAVSYIVSIHMVRKLKSAVCSLLFLDYVTGPNILKLNSTFTKAENVCVCVYMF